MENNTNKRLLILHAALKIFSRDGFHKAKVSTIASEAGVGKGTIYEYFYSKNQVFEEMLRYHTDIYLKMLEKSIETENTIDDKFKRYIAFEEDLMRRHGDLANIFMREAHNIGIETKNILISIRNRKIHMLAEIINEGIKKGIFRKVNPHAAAIAFMSSIHQILVDEIFLKDDLKNLMAIDHLIDIFQNGIKK